jgi:hypothetical protein
MRVNSSGGSPAGTGSTSDSNKHFGIFLGKIKENTDPEGLGRLRVWIPQLSTAREDDASSWYTVRYCPPFAGASNTADESQANNATAYEQTNQGYGFWAVPPHKNVNVICAFINGESHQGIWWSCLPHDGHTHSIPAVASGSTHNGKVKPLSERNRYNTKDPQKENRPEHLLSDILSKQGLENDLRRGHSNAGPFRDKDKHPGLAYGFLTPGQHQFVLDDGEKGNGGQIRLRTNSGNTMIMDNDEGFIYFINANGSAWMQLDKEGNVDIYAAGDISFAAEKSINLHAGNNINIEAAANINAVATNNIQMEACQVFNATGTTGMKLTSNQNMNVYADSQFKATALRIDLNGPTADIADKPQENSLVTNTTVGKSIAGRVPEAEPYGGHVSRTGGEQITTPPGRVAQDDNLGNPQITPDPKSYEDLPPPTTADAIDCVADFSASRLSETGFEKMMSREAYRGMQYSDYQGYSIGYGTRIDIFGPQNSASKLDSQIKNALLAGPSEVEARTASRQIVDRHVAPGVISTLKKESAGKKVCITQAQVDALIIAAYGNPSSANSMATQLVAAAAKQPDGKPTNSDIAGIWANASYSNSSTQRNSEARYAMTGSGNPDDANKSAASRMTAGVKSDTNAVINNKARNPQNGAWRTADGNGPSTGTKVEAAYTAPTPRQFGQYERSTWLNTGKVPQGSRLTEQQLKDKYGSPGE